MALIPLDFVLLFTVVILLLYAQGVYTLAVGLEFTSQPQDVIAVKGRPLLLNCSTHTSTQYAPVQIKWTKNGKLLEDSRNLLLNGSLYLRKVVHRKSRGRSDAGVYQCIAENTAGAILSQPAHVQVAVLPRFTQEPLPQSVHVGHSVRLACEVKHAVPQPHYSWSFNGGPLPQSQKFVQLSSGVLQIHDVQMSDGGEYSCTATNSANTRTTPPALLTVTTDDDASPSLPSILNSVENVSVGLGETAVLECLAGATHNPNYSWQRQDGTSLPSGRASYIQGNLQLSDVTVADSGVYICTVTGNSYNLKTTATLTALQRPVLRTAPISIETKPALTAKFICTADGHPTPNITWYKDARPLAITGRFATYPERDLGGDVGERLTVGQPMQDDAGYYQCRVGNQAGVVMGTARLEMPEVHDAPDPPRSIRAEPLSSTEVLVTWSPPAVKIVNGQPLQILGYSIHYWDTEGGHEFQKVASDITVEGEQRLILPDLDPFTNYTVYVVAYTTTLSSSHSQKVTVKTTEDIPIAAPKVFVNPETSTSLLVDWVPLDGGHRRGRVTKYRVHWREAGLTDSDRVIELPGNHIEYIIQGLEMETEYEVRVEAGTAMGFSSLTDEQWPWISQSTKDNADVVPNQVNMDAYAIGTTMINVTWTTNPKPGVSTQFYIIRWYKTGTSVYEAKIKIVENNIHNVTLARLEPETSYIVEVLAGNEQGDSAERTQIVNTPGDSSSVGYVPRPQAMPPPPLDVDVRVMNATTVKVTWTLPSGQLGKVVAYTVRYAPQLHHHIFNRSNGITEHFQRKFAAHSGEMELVVGRLLPYTWYDFAVASHSAARGGPYSRPVSIQTKPAVPSAPLNVRGEVQDAGVVQLHWMAPHVPNGVITSYTVIHANDDTLTYASWSATPIDGTKTKMLINNLPQYVLYYFRVRAVTLAGPGPWSTQVTIMVPGQGGVQGSVDGVSDQMMGVIIGIAIGGTCIIVCAIIILLRNRCSPPPAAQCRHGYPVNGNGHAHPVANGEAVRISGSHSMEMQMHSYTPILNTSQVTENDELDSKGGGSLILRNGGNGIVLPPLNGLSGHHGHVTHGSPNQSGAVLDEEVTSSTRLLPPGRGHHIINQGSVHQGDADTNRDIDIEAGDHSATGHYIAEPDHHLPQNHNRDTSNRNCSPQNLPHERGSRHLTTSGCPQGVARSPNVPRVGSQWQPTDSVNQPQDTDSSRVYVSPDRVPTRGDPPHV